MHEVLIERATEAFRSRFGSSPRFGAVAPGRVNLIGEHTDYNDGFVLPIAIDRATVIVASRVDDEDDDVDSPRNDDDRDGGAAGSVFVAGDLGLEVAVDLRRPLPRLEREHRGAFGNYLFGVIEEFRELGAAPPNMQLVVHSSVPIGAGLSSSAAVEVAMATILEQMTGCTLDDLDKALLCQRAEHAWPGTPCGIMDMYVSIAGRRDHALLIDCRSNRAEPIRLPPSEEMSLLVVDTGVKHDLAAGEYAERRSACRGVAGILGLDSLRDATVGLLDLALRDGRIDMMLHRRAAHVVLENVRTLLAAQALTEGRIDGFCAQMFESHKSLRNLYDVSCPELDLIVDTCSMIRDELNEPRLGARMTGGGFGGCAIVCTPTESIDAVEAVIASRFEQEFGRSPTMIRTVAADGARAVDPAAPESDLPPA